MGKGKIQMEKRQKKRREERGGIAWGNRGKERTGNSCRRIFVPGVKLFKPGPHSTGLQGRAPVIDETGDGGDPQGDLYGG